MTTFSKRLVLALVAMSVSPLTFAGTYTPPVCTSHAVTIPCESTAWDVGFEVFWANATPDDLNYAYTTNIGDNAFSYKRQEVEYQFGFELDVSMHFATGNDLTVRWERSHNDHRDNFVAPLTDTSRVITNYGVDGSLFFNSNKVVVPGDAVSSQYRYNFDAVNAEFGQHIDVGDDMDLRLHGGLQYARIDFTKTLQYTTAKGAQGSTNITNSLVTESDFDGLGARMGLDADYYVGQGFGVVGRGAIGLIVGNIESQLLAYNDATGSGATLSGTGTAVLKEVINFESENVVVPTALIKAGVNYGNDMFYGHVNFEAGWRWEGYFQSIRFVPNVAAEVSSFTLAGPYLSVSYVA